MKKLWNKIRKAFAIHNISKRFKIEFTVDGYDGLLCSIILDAKNEDEVIQKFNSLDLESRRNIVSVNVY